MQTYANRGKVGGGGGGGCVDANVHNLIFLIYKLIEIRNLWYLQELITTNYETTTSQNLLCLWGERGKQSEGQC